MERQKEEKMNRQYNNLLRMMIKIIQCPECGKRDMKMTRKPPIALVCKSCGYFEEKPE